MKHMNRAFYQLGVDDYYPAVFILMPLSLVAIYQVAACYLLYGIKRTNEYNKIKFNNYSLGIY